VAYKTKAHRLTAEQIKIYEKEIDKLDHYEMAKLRRFAPPGHIYFCDDLYLYFENRFQNLGGMTPEISKAISEGAP
jgi:hypothetical protein